nr:hypothetical protein [Chloroflexia bacterium]
MEIVAGLSLKNLAPRVWDPVAADHLPDLGAVMVSYAEFHAAPLRRRRAMEQGLHAYLGAPPAVRVYLDNGAFAFRRRSGETPVAAYEEFVREARPDWFPIPQDFIPAPAMTLAEQRACLAMTMAANRLFATTAHVPIVHVAAVIDEAIVALRSVPGIADKAGIGIGGIVPNLLRMPKAMPYREVLRGVAAVRTAFPAQKLHLFGVGGTATLHLAALLGMDSVDSSGWRNRAARGLVQMPGSGDRLVADLGKWRGRQPTVAEWVRLESCSCPACEEGGIPTLTAGGRDGFRHRATHNLWVLL